MQDSDTGIDTIFNVPMPRVSEYIRCLDLNSMTYILVIFIVQVRLLSWHCNRIGLEKKVGLFCKKILHF